MRSLRIVLLFNSKKSVPHTQDSPVDYAAEYDTEETINGLEQALRSRGHQVMPLEGDISLLDNIRRLQPDICFNICEGLRGESRESHVPALLEMLGIPYTASGVLANALSLDKAMGKMVWQAAGLPTAPFQVLHRGDEPLAAGLEFPLFLKPVREGSGMGINERSIAHNEQELRQQARWLASTYRQPVLVESFLPGHEYTIGILGNERAIYRLPDSPLYDERGFHAFPPLEIDVSEVEDAGGLYTSHIKSEKPLAPRYLCPAPCSPELMRQMQTLAVDAFTAINALDVGRVDFRLDGQGRPQLLEINTLPGVNPRYSDIVFAARGEGMSYETLINEILSLAVARYGLS
ncbi:MAG: D-alanine--D-alanine ligase family protein [Anaerolineae bacterium]